MNQHMKTRQILLGSIVLIAAFLTAQSFIYRSNKRTVQNPSYYKSFPGTVAVCGPGFNTADSAVNMPELKGWGHYSRKISSASDSAQLYFDQGLSMYYAFHSIEAIASFTKATEIDPDCAMAWYGKALAMGPTINYENGYRPPSGAYDAAVKSKALSENCTPLEKDLINAIQQRYSSDTATNVTQLRINYAQAMQLVYEKHQGDVDAVTLYADALLLLHPWNLYDHNFKPRSWTPQIRSLLEQGMRLSPSHPGANHYYIHTMEASGEPQVALHSANLLDTLMPDVAHITHMPSHIYIRTGFYERGIKVNDDAVAGFQKYLKQYAPVMNGFFLYQAHNVQLKGNCAQMAGNYKTSADASASLQKMIPPAFLGMKTADGNYVEYVYALPILNYVRFGKWDEVLKTPVIDSLAYASSLQHFSRGIAYSRKHNFTMARQELKILNERLLDKSLKLKMDNGNPANKCLQVGVLILKGVMAEEQNQYAAAIKLLQSAVVAEDLLIYNEPRDWPLPARQYLGNTLIRAGKSKEAIAVLNKDLLINPNNGWSLTGLKIASRHAGNAADLAKINQRLNAAWKIKDLDIENSVF
jgi:tetratricopeptide (TPR) repeat protein